MGFTLSFHFHANEFFTNTILTKHFILACKRIAANPFDFEVGISNICFGLFLVQGPVIYKCEGSEIDWKCGKNVTVKVVEKKIKKQKITKEIKAHSFFNFFNMPSNSISDAPDAELDEELLHDFFIGEYFK